MLARGHGLYGPSATPPQGLGSSAAALDNAARTPFLVSGPASTDSGRAHVGLVDWAQDGNRHLGSLGDDDRNTNRVMQQGAAATGDGRQATGAVLTDARTTAAAMAPWQNLPAGERALLLQMRARLLQQQKQLKLSQAQARQLAARLRNTGSGGSKGSGMGMPSLGGSHGGGGNRGSGGGALSGLSGLSGLARAARRRRTVAASRTGVIPGFTAPGAVGSNASARDVAAAIIHQARIRRYTPEQAVAVLSTAMQESGLRPGANGGDQGIGGALGIFQQGNSYGPVAARLNPNTAIAAFFNRLDANGGPASGNIWHSIVGVQQHGGAWAGTGGDHKYLGEIMSQRGRAQQLYSSIVGTTTTTVV